MNEPEKPPGDDSQAVAIEEVLAQVPFALWLGLELSAIDGDRVVMQFSVRDELIGNPAKKVLHGGVISAVLDTVGGFAALRGVLTQMPETTGRASTSPWLSTIDLRTDYLLRGSGDRFVASAFPLRVGSRFVVTRMELHGKSGDLVAVGTGTYVVP